MSETDSSQQPTISLEETAEPLLKFLNSLWVLLNTNLVILLISSIIIYYTTFKIQNHFWQLQRDRDISVQIRKLDRELESRALAWKNAIVEINENYKITHTYDINALNLASQMADSPKQIESPDLSSTTLNGLIEEYISNLQDSSDSSARKNLPLLLVEKQKWRFFKATVKEFNKSPNDFNNDYKNIKNDRSVAWIDMNGPLSFWLARRSGRIDDPFDYNKYLYLLICIIIVETAIIARISWGKIGFIIVIMKIMMSKISEAIRVVWRLAPFRTIRFRIR